MTPATDTPPAFTARRVAFYSLALTIATLTMLYSILVESGVLR